MIDTDKYEGHTRGPWTYYDDEEHDCWVFEGEDIEAQARVAFFAFTPCEGIAYLDDPDLNLMIDAPLLLEEVKWLRNIVFKFDDAIYHGNFDISQLLGIWHNLLRQLTKEEEE